MGQLPELFVHRTWPAVGATLPFERRPLEPEEEIEIEFMTGSEATCKRCECPAIEDVVAELEPIRRVAVSAAVFENLLQECLIGTGLVARLRAVCSCRKRGPKRRGTRRRVGRSYQEPEW